MDKKNMASFASNNPSFAPISKFLNYAAQRLSLKTAHIVGEIMNHHGLLVAINNLTMKINEITQPNTPEQSRVNQLKANKDRASDALKNERERQKRMKAYKTLSSLNQS